MKDKIKQLSLDSQKHFAVWCARRVLHIFEEKYPEDRRPRKALEAAEDPNATKKELWDAAAAAAAADASANASAAAYAAAYAANAAAAYAAANAYTAYANAYDASAYAAYAAASASYASAANADANIDLERKAQTEYLDHLLEEQNKPIHYVIPFNRPQAVWNF